MSKQDLIKNLKLGTRRWVFQKELTSDGVPHFQGRVSFKQPKRITEVKWIHKKGKLSIESQEQESEFYCTDLDKCIDGPWSNKTERTIYIPKRYRNPALRPWQQRLLDIIKKDLRSFEDREIIIVQEPIGAVGKSWFAGYLKISERALWVPSTMITANDMVQFVMNITYDGWHGILCIDLPRAMSKKHFWNIAQAIECLKNGFLYDGRYCAKERVIEPPVIVCFCNALPPKESMSTDRWRLYEITQDGLLISSTWNKKTEDFSGAAL